MVEIESWGLCVWLDRNGTRGDVGGVLRWAVVVATSRKPAMMRGAGDVGLR